MALGSVASGACACTYMPGSNMASGLGNVARSVTVPVPGSTTCSVNCSVPCRPYSDPSGKVQSHRRLSGHGAAGGQSARQSEQVGARLRHIHPDRIEFLDGRQRCRLSRGDKRALGHECPPDPAGQRRPDLREIEIDLSSLQRRPGLADICDGLAVGGLRVIRVLFGHRAILRELPKALRAILRGGDQRFCTRECGRCLVHRRPERRIFDLVEDLPLANERALLERHAADDASDLRPHF